MEWIESLILGAVQGLTEFLPISSDGHLSITQAAFAKLTGHGRSGAENLFFDVMLHLGTLSAIIIYYRAVSATATKGLLGSVDVPPSYRRAQVIRTGLLAGVATTPLIPLALFLKKWIDKTFESTLAAGIGFLITAAVLLITSRLQRRDEGGKGPTETSWRDALLIGIAQMFAPLPGVSRSGLTVCAALGLGLSRAWAVGFSLLIAVPAILGAAVFEIKKLDPHTLTGDRIAQTALAAVLAGVVGYGAIIWLVKIVRSGKMWYFSVYLVLLGLAVIASSLAATKDTPDSHGAIPDARRENPADGSVRREPTRPPAGRGAVATVGALAGTVDPGGGASQRSPRAEREAKSGPEGLVLGRSLAGRS